MTFWVPHKTGDSKIGYSFKHNFEPQMNSLFLFSVNNLKPLFYRLLPGNITDVKAFKLTMHEADLKQAQLLQTKDFIPKITFKQWIT